MATLLRSEWPKVREIIVRGVTFFQVDARKQGTSGKRETFSEVGKALERAEALVSGAVAAKQHQEQLEAAGLVLPVEVRAQTVNAQERLKPLGVSLLDAVNTYADAVEKLAKFGRGVADAVSFYVAHLEQEAIKESSALISLLAADWETFKEKGTLKKLRQDTLDDISETKSLLVREWGNLRIREITEAHVTKYLEGLSVGPRRRYNLKNRIGQFFNWAIKQKHTTFNPCAAIEIEVPYKDVEIFVPSDVERIMRLCEKEFPDLILYHALCFFAGLRPTECLLLTWENIHLKEKQITVLSTTSKVIETRNVPIEDTLLKWLKAYLPEKLEGLVTRNVNFRPRIEKLRAALGFKAARWGALEGEEWVEDIMRHTYASYWLGLNKDRAHLAENMGTSLKMIKKHYKRIVAESAVKAFWRLLPQKKLKAALGVKR